MRILLAHNYYQDPGGEDLSFSAHGELLREAGHDVSTYTRQNSEVNEIPRITAAGEMIWSDRTYRDLRQIIREQKIQVVHFHNIFMRISPSAYYACKAEGAAVVQDLRNYRLLCPAATFFRDGAPCEDCLGHLPWPGIVHGCWRGSRSQTAVVASMLTAHRALGTWSTKIDRYITLTEDARRRFIDGDIPSSKIIVKPNFLRPPTAQEIPREPFALYVGRLSAEKGIVTILTAWQSFSDFPLKIAGDGPLRDFVRNAVESQPDQLQWLGQQTHTDIQNLMGRASVLIFPSIWFEGMPRTILEAFASGLPVIASNLGAMQEMITDNQTGLLFRPGDPKDLATKVAWARANSESLADIAQNARTEIEHKYSPERNYQILIDIYEQAIHAASQI